MSHFHLLPCKDKGAFVHCCLLFSFLSLMWLNLGLQLLEGLQSSLIISKIPSGSHDKVHKNQNRNTSKGEEF